MNWRCNYLHINMLASQEHTQLTDSFILDSDSLLPQRLVIQFYFGKKAKCMQITYWCEQPKSTLPKPNEASKNPFTISYSESESSKH